MKKSFRFLKTCKKIFRYLHYLHCDVCTRIGQIELGLSSGEKALNLIEKCRCDGIIVGYHARTLQLLGLLYTNTESFGKAVYIYQKLLGLLGEFEVPGLDLSAIQEKTVAAMISFKKPLQAQPILDELLQKSRSAHLLSQQAALHIFSSNYSEAKSCLQEAFQSLLQKNTLEAYKILSKLAFVKIQLQEFKSSLTDFANCIEILKEIQTETSPEMLWIYSQMGQILYTDKEYEKALDKLKISKIIAEELGIRDKEYGISLLFIGKIQMKMSNFTEALQYFVNARRVLESTGKENALEAVLALLELYLQQGNTVKSWEILQEIEKQSYSPCASAMAENEMGNLLRNFGYNTQAMRFYEAASRKYEILKGENSLEVGKTYLNIGALCIQQGKYALGYDYLWRSKEIKQKFFGEYEKEMALVYEEIGKCLNLMGKKHLGREFIGKAKRIYKKMGLGLN